jgi:tRNA threonylcarbamoyladenosine biosynthesis protein TsaE
VMPVRKFGTRLESGRNRMREQSRRQQRFLPQIIEIVTGSAAETQTIGRRLGSTLAVPSVVLLRGLLGSGKTTLVRGIAAGLGLKDLSLVNSPSFTLVNIYRGRCPIYHVDLYRLKGSSDIDSIGLDEFMGREGVTIVEWSERLGDPAPAAVAVELEDAGGDSRGLRITFCGRSQRRQFCARNRAGRLP